MRILKILLIVIGIGLIIMLVTKPSDEYCRSKARDAILSHNQTTPGYENPLNPVESAAPAVDSASILVENNFLWKTINYTSNNGTEKIGYGMFNTFYDVSQNRKNTK